MKLDLSPELEAALRNEESGPLAALVAERNARHLTSLRELVKSLGVEPAIRTRALWALGLWGDPDVVRDIEAVLSGLTPRERVAAVDALGRIGSDQALRVLTTCATDPSAQVRKFVVKALARSNHPTDKARLAKMSAEDPERWIRELAATARKGDR